MKTERISSFQYSNAATLMIVNATEFDSPLNGKFWTVRIIFNEKDRLLKPRSRAEAVQIADEAVAEFVAELYELHCAENKPN